MTSLHLGKYTNKELAEWFGIKTETFTRYKKKKLEELKNFADFDEIYGGIYITNIKEPTYNKNSQKIRELYQKGFEELRSAVNCLIGDLHLILRRRNAPDIGAVLIEAADR